MTLQEPLAEVFFNEFAVDVILTDDSTVSFRGILHAPGITDNTDSYIITDWSVVVISDVAKPHVERGTKLTIDGKRFVAQSGLQGEPPDGKVSRIELSVDVDT